MLIWELVHILNRYPVSIIRARGLLQNIKERDLFLCNDTSWVIPRKRSSNGVYTCFCLVLDISRNIYLFADVSRSKLSSIVY